MNLQNMNWVFVAAMTSLLISVFLFGLWVGNRQRKSAKRNEPPRDGYTTMDSSKENVLSAFLSMMMDDIKRIPEKWDNLLCSYIQRNNPGASPRDRSAMRGNLNKTFGRDIMSWYSFMTFLQVIAAKRYTFKLLVTWQDNTTSEYEVQVDEENQNV